MTTEFDNLIIGFGKGGKTLAAWLAAQGQQVALIERAVKMYGGSCINIACIPSKSLILNGEKQKSYQEAYREKNELTSLLRKRNFEKLDRMPQVTVITGQASFISANKVHVKVKSGETLTLTANRIFINTGSKPFVPDISGIASSNRVFTSTTLMEQSLLPEKLVIIGAGFIGLEFACMYASFGTQVTILDGEAAFLPKEDEDVSAAVRNVLAAKNIEIITAATVQKIKDTHQDTVKIFYNDTAGGNAELEASALLVAAGRKPDVEDLNLSAAGIRTDSRGYIAVDENLKTSQPHIWAIGDANGGPQFTYISLDDFRIIRDQLSGGVYTTIAKRKETAFCVFITPPLAHIGLREREAIAKGLTVKVARLPAGAIPRAQLLNMTDGFLKSVIDAKTNKILGCTLFCADAHEMINTVQIAMNAQLDYKVLRDAIFTHPSMTESLNDLYASLP